MGRRERFGRDLHDLPMVGRQEFPAPLTTPSRSRARTRSRGTQRIGWDPVAGQFRSWDFDSQGGYSEGLWSRDGDRWIIKMSACCAVKDLDGNKYHHPRRYCTFREICCMSCGQAEQPFGRGLNFRLGDPGA